MDCDASAKNQARKRVFLSAAGRLQNPDAGRQIPGVDVVHDVKGSTRHWHRQQSGDKPNRCPAARRFSVQCPLKYQHALSRRKIDVRCQINNAG